MELFEQIYEALVQRNRDAVLKLSREVLDRGIDPTRAIEQGFKRGMERIGEMFAELEIFIPDMITAADIMNEGLAILQPALKAHGGGGTEGKILLGTIQGDVHEIGKNIVRILLEGSGFHVVDLGRDVNVLTFIDRYRELNPEIIGISALMTNTMINIPRVIEDLKRLGIREQVKIMVGGAPVLPDWAEEIGADGCGQNAKEAVGMAKEWLEA
jgi:corrinoid protein of di/trimethylamine methyltransferase